MSKILKSYKLLQDLAHLDVQLQQRRLKEIEVREQEIEVKIKVFQEQLCAEREFVRLNPTDDASLVMFEVGARERLEILKEQLKDIQKKVEEEKEILKDFFLNEKKFEHVYAQAKNEKQKKEMYQELLEIEDLTMMRQKNNSKV